MAYGDIISGAGRGASMGAMTGNPYVAAGGAVLGGLAGALGARSSNRRLPRGIQYQPYSGYRPPPIDYNGINNLRNVQQTITDTLLRRSQGLDVGYDPRLLTSATNAFNATQAQQAERQNQDITNELSGTGQSRNLAARALTLGRSAQDRERQKTQFLGGLDVANLERANQEKQAATAGLQNLNTFDFGQENERAAFDLDVYNAQNAAQQGAYPTQLSTALAYNSPLASGIQSGLDVTGAMSGMNLNNSIAQALRQRGGGTTFAGAPASDSGSYGSYGFGVPSIYDAKRGLSYKFGGQ